MSGAPPRLIHDLLRDLAPRVLAAVARRYDDFGAAEDAVQEALIAAAPRWETDGVPGNPRGWLYQVAVRRLTDRIRSDVARHRREEAAVRAAWDGAEPSLAPSFGDMEADEDDSLTLCFMCCHPALTPSSAIALTLRAVGGLSTAEIAAGFLVPEATMAQRISRAKQSIRASGIPFALPDEGERAARLGAVLRVLYLVFNEGYTSSAGEHLVRPDLATEAIRMTRMLHALLPADGEVAGLLALMLLTDARRDARTGPAGELIPLDEQDRTRWRRAPIAEGVALAEQAMRRPPLGAYQIQAAIAALHDEAASTEATDWPQILALYRVLRATDDSPMAALSEAVAIAMVEGPGAGLARLDLLADDPRLREGHRLEAVRAHLLERQGRGAEAAVRYRAAAGRTASLPERHYLLTRAERADAAAPDIPPDPL